MPKRKAGINEAENEYKIATPSSAVRRTKKQRLAEARERSRLWAEEQKEKAKKPPLTPGKLKSSSKKPTTATPKATIKTKPSSTTKKTTPRRGSTSRAASSPKRTPVANTARINSDLKPPPPPTTAIKKTPNKAELRAQARARAQAWRITSETKKKENTTSVIAPAAAPANSNEVRKEGYHSSDDDESSAPQARVKAHKTWNDIRKQNATRINNASAYKRKQKQQDEYHTTEDEDDDIDNKVKIKNKKNNKQEDYHTTEDEEDDIDNKVKNNRKKNNNEREEYRTEDEGDDDNRNNNEVSSADPTEITIDSSMGIRPFASAPVAAKPSYNNYGNISGKQQYSSYAGQANNIQKHAMVKQPTPYNAKIPKKSATKTHFDKMKQRLNNPIPTYISTNSTAEQNKSQPNPYEDQMKNKKYHFNVPKLPASIPNDDFDRSNRYNINKTDNHETWRMSSMTSNTFDTMKSAKKQHRESILDYNDTSERETEHDRDDSPNKHEGASFGTAEELNSTWDVLDEVQVKGKRSYSRIIISILLASAAAITAGMAYRFVDFGALKDKWDETNSKLPVSTGELFPQTLVNVFQNDQSVTSTTAAHPCFVYNYKLLETEMHSDSPRNKCDQTLERIPCPEGGRCAEGILHSCHEKNKIVSSDGSLCIWNEDTNKSFAHIEAMLTNWTINNYCELKGAKHAYKSPNSKSPVFPFSVIANNTMIKKEMLLNSSDFIFSEIKDEVMIGFSDNYTNNKLVLPRTCWISLATVQLFQALGSVVLHGGFKVASWMFQFVIAYPIISTLASLIYLIVISIFRRREKMQKLADDVVEVRNLAYKEMMQNSSEHVVLHLRDGIAMDMHPKSRQGRAYIITKVWPRVVVDIRQDNRVRKTNRRFGMKPRDIWQWVAAPSPHSGEVNESIRKKKLITTK